MTTVCDPLQLLAALPNGSVSVFDRDLRYVYAAGQGLHDVGLRPEALVGRRLQEAFPGDAASLVETQYRRAFGGEAVVFGFHYFHRTYALSAAPFEQRDGRVEQIIVLAQNITPLGPIDKGRPPASSAGEQPEEPDDWDRVMATLGHELRNPLGAMRAAAALIRHSPDRPTREHAREVIERQLTAAEALIQDLGELSRARRGVLSVRFSAVQMQAVIRDAAETLAHLATEAGHRVRVLGCVPPHLTIRADSQRLLQVFTNLLTNAIRYTPRGGDIAIGCEQTGDGVSIAVTDNGRGIAPAHLDTIFDLFHRGDDRDTHGGLGVGLSVAREIVLLHGGRIDVFSPGLGQGTTFTVQLPLALIVDYHPTSP